MSLMTRREAIAVGAGAVGAAIQGESAQAAAQGPAVRNGRLKQSVSRWPYGDVPFRDFCQAVRDMGLEAIDLAAA